MFFKNRHKDIVKQLTFAAQCGEFRKILALSPSEYKFLIKEGFLVDILWEGRKKSAEVFWSNIEQPGSLSEQMYILAAQSLYKALH